MPGACHQARQERYAQDLAEYQPVCGDQGAPCLIWLAYISHLALLVMVPLALLLFLPDTKALLALAFLTLDPSTLASHRTSYSSHLPVIFLCTYVM